MTVDYDKMKLTYRYSTKTLKGQKYIIETLKTQRAMGEWSGILRCYKLGDLYYIEQWEYHYQINIGEEVI